MEFSTNELLENYNQYNQSVVKELQVIIEDLNENRTEMIREKFSYFAEGLQWLEEVANYLKTKDITINYSLEDLDNHLEILVDSLEKQDYVMLSDIIEYELIPYFENLKVEN